MPLQSLVLVRSARDPYMCSPRLNRTRFLWGAFLSSSKLIELPGTIVGKTILER